MIAAARGEPAGGWPRITLITPSLNQGRFLEAAIRSVVDQAYPDLEYFVFDGGSTDGSVDVLREHGERLAFWESVPDEGQSHAIEKGMMRATGEIANWINADDLLRPGSLFTVGRAYRETGADLVVGEDDHFTEDPSVPVRRFHPSGYEFPDCLRFWTGGFRYHQPPTFFTRRIYERAGGIDRSLRYVMDYDLYCRMLALPGVTVAYVPETLSAFRLHPDSKTEVAKAEFLREQRDVSRRYWEGAGLSDEEELPAMDRYSAHCAVHQASSALRHGDIAGSLRRLRDAVRWSPAQVISSLLGSTTRASEPRGEGRS